MVSMHVKMYAMSTVLVDVTINVLVSSSMCLVYGWDECVYTLVITDSIMAVMSSVMYVSRSDTRMTCR